MTDFVLKKIRRIAEIILREKVIKRKIYVNNQVLKIFLSPDSQLKYLGTNIDQDLRIVVEKYIKPGMTVLDIGANCGVFGFMSILNGAQKVYFFEPDLFLVKLLEKTIKLNKLWRQCSILPIAMANKPRIMEFDIAARGRASNSISNLGRLQKGGVRYSIDILACPLNMFQEIAIGSVFLKVDVEGAEVLIIEGGKQFLEDIKPTVLIEVSNDNSEWIIQSFLDLGYNYREAFKNNLIFTHSLSGEVMS